MSELPDLPKYKCHRAVGAAQILGVANAGNHIYLLLDLAGRPERKESLEWAKKHKPSAGGYYVQYEDGYTGYIHKEVFEAGYARFEEEAAISQEDFDKSKEHIEAVGLAYQAFLGAPRECRLAAAAERDSQASTANMDEVQEVVDNINDIVRNGEVVTGEGEAPTVTLDHINSIIVSERYFTADDGAYGAYKRNDDVHVGSRPTHGSESLALLTFCVLVLQNGFTVVGKSACAAPERFDAELGRKYAREDAVNQVWPLEGYLLKERLYRGAEGTHKV